MNASNIGIPNFTFCLFLALQVRYCLLRVELVNTKGGFLKGTMVAQPTKLQLELEDPLGIPFPEVASGVDLLS
jgi:hypothetical protein